MTEHERKMLAEAAIPIEALCMQIRSKPYTELSHDIQSDLLMALDTIRTLLFGEPWCGDMPTHCDICQHDIGHVFIDGMIVSVEARPWGIMCEFCHVLHGNGLGEGKGQKYQKQGNVYIKVAAG